MRCSVVVVAISLLGGAADAGAPKRPTKHRTVKKRTASKRIATKHAATKHTTGKRRPHTASREPHPAVKTTAKPLVRVAQKQADGRVRYGADHLPPGFAWPPTPAMIAASRACEAQLDALGVVWKSTVVEGMITDPIVVPSMEIGGIRYTSAFRRKDPPAMDCQFVQALARLGPDLRELGVREVQFGSVYRNTLARSHGQTHEFLSRHALGIAMDVKAFVDASGRVATVETDYLKDDPLLHGIEDLVNQRTSFRQVLSPANDPISHDDHFHIEASVDFTGFR